MLQSASSSWLKRNLYMGWNNENQVAGRICLDFCSTLHSHYIRHLPWQEGHCEHLIIAVLRLFFREVGTKTSCRSIFRDDSLNWLNYAKLMRHRRYFLTESQALRWLDHQPINQIKPKQAIPLKSRSPRERKTWKDLSLLGVLNLCFFMLFLHSK